MDITLSKRTQIRHYLVNLLKEKVDIGGRVFATRANSPLFLEELPALCVSFTTEVNDVIVGSEYLPKEYQRSLSVVISAVVDTGRIEASDPNKNQSGEDYLDWLMLQVENAINSDRRLARNLPDFDPNTNTKGLTFGAKHASTVTYDADTESERKMLAQDATWIFPYNTKAYLDLKLSNFNEYYAAITRVGSDANTVDRVLISAEGAPNGND